MTDWLFTWKGIASATVVVLGAIALGIALREGTAGNVASIVGLAVSVLGFVLTIWTVFDAQKQIRTAIGQAREETRRAVKGIAAQLRAADWAALRGGVEDLRQAAQDTKWPRAVYRCMECRTVAYRLAQDYYLTDEEKTQLRGAADDFQLICRFIERYRLTGQTGTLQDRQMQKLDDVIGLLAQIQARLLHEPLRPVEESSPS